MKVFFKTLLATALVVGMLPMAVHAGGCGLRDQLDDIDQRIDRAVDAGRMTARDVRQLQRERDEIRGLFRDFKETQGEDISPESCDVLARRVDRLSRHVERMSNGGDGPGPEGFVRHRW